MTTVLIVGGILAVIALGVAYVSARAAARATPPRRARLRVVRDDDPDTDAMHDDWNGPW